MHLHRLDHYYAGPGFDLVRLKGREAKLRYVMSNSFGFGGINASLVFGKVE